MENSQRQASIEVSENGPWTPTLALRRHSLSRHLGLEQYSIRRLFLLAVCILGVVQYGIVLVWGVVENDLRDYYGLTTDQATNLYTWLNLGSCALSFIPGVLYDSLGPSITMFIGTLVGVFPVLLQMAWTENFPSWLSTQAGLSLCYVFFGLSATFYNVIGCLAPLLAFKGKHVGKASAVVQVCLSLGLTVQSTAYSAIKSSGGDFVEKYLIYELVCTSGFGVLMTFVLWYCWPVFNQPRLPNISPAENSPSLGSALVNACSGDLASLTPRQRLKRQLGSGEFLYMSVFFLGSVGFSFSFLEVESKIASTVNLDADQLGVVFGILNALGRIIVSLPLDYTKGHPLGGIQTYMLLSLIVFVSGLLFLTIPSSPGAGAVEAANAVVALGYGGMNGIVPLALQDFFGAEHLGIIYGLLYLWAYFAVYFWGVFSGKVSDCTDVSCYRPYCLGGAFSSIVVIAIGSCFLIKEVRSNKAGGRSGRLEKNCTDTRTKNEERREASRATCP